VGWRVALGILRRHGVGDHGRITVSRGVGFQKLRICVDSCARGAPGARDLRACTAGARAVHALHRELGPLCRRLRHREGCDRRQARSLLRGKILSRFAVSP
jgi:hypothetical protein